MWDKKEIRIGALGVFFIWMIGLSSWWMHTGQSQQAMSIGTDFVNAVQTEIPNGNSGANEEVTVLDMDSYPDGGVVMSGFYKGTPSIGSGVSIPPSSDTDAFVARFSPQKTLLWWKVIDGGTVHLDVGAGVEVLPNGNIILTGRLSADNQNSFATRAYVHIYDPNGVSVKQFSSNISNGGDQLNDVDSFADNDFVVCGTQNSDSLSFGSTVSNKGNSSSTFMVFRLGLNASSQVLTKWVNNAEGFLTTSGCKDVLIDTQGDVYVAATFSGGLFFGPGSPAGSGVFLAKYNGVSGAQEFVIPISGLSVVSHFIDMDLLSNGDIVLVASTAVDISSDVYIGRITPSGVISKNEIITNSGSSPRGIDGAHGVDVFSDDSFLVSGYLGSQLLFGSGNQSQTLTPNGTEDAFVAFYDQDLNFQWAKQMTSPGLNRAYDVSITDQDSFFIAGTFTNGLDLDLHNAQSIDLSSQSTEKSLFLAEYGLKFALPASQLALVNQPIDGFINALPQQALHVSVNDAQGQRVTSFSDTVTLSLAVPALGVTLKGEVSVNAVDGLAVFDEWYLSDVGQGYVLQVGTNGFPTVNTDVFSISQVSSQLQFVEHLKANQAGSLLRIEDVITDLTGGFLASGNFFNNGIWGDTDPARIARQSIDISSGGGDGFVSRYSSNHEISWLDTINSNGVSQFPDEGRAMAYLSDGSIVVVGLGGRSGIPSGLMIAKLSRDTGNMVYTKTYPDGGAIDDIFTDVIATSDGYIAVAQNLALSITIDGITVSNRGAVQGQITLARFLNDGSVVWVKHIETPTTAPPGGGFTRLDIFPRLTLAPDGTFYVVGNYPPSSVFGTNEAAETTLSTPGTGFLAHYNADGTLRFAQSLDDYTQKSENFGPQSVGVFSNGDVVVAGNTSSSGLSQINLQRFSSSGTLLQEKLLLASGVSRQSSVKDLVVRSDDSFLLTGTFTPQMSFPHADGSYDLSSVSAAPDVFVGQFGKQFDALWVQNAGGTSSDDVSSVTLSTDESTVYIGGHMPFSNLVFSPGTPEETSITSTNGSLEAYVAAYTLQDSLSGGPVQLAFVQEPTNSSQYRTIFPSVSVEIQDSQGNRVTSATNTITLTLSTNPTSSTLMGTLSSPAVNGVAVFDDLVLENTSAGYVIEASSNGLTSVDSDPFRIYYVPPYADSSESLDTRLSVDLDVLSDGTSAQVGDFINAVFDAGTPEMQTVSSNLSNINAYISKYDAQHNLLWVRTTDGSTNAATGLGVSLFPDGSVVAVGQFSDTVTFAPEIAQPITVSSGAVNSSDCFLIRYQSNGDFDWFKRIVSSGSDSCDAVEALSDGGFVVSGSFIGSAIFGQNEANETTLNTNNSSEDAFLARYNRDGTLQWVKSAGGTDAEFEVDVEVLPQGNIVIAGFFDSSSFLFGSGASAVTLALEGQRDLFLAQYTMSGDFVWATSIANNNFGTTNFKALDIAGSPDGGLYLTGPIRGMAHFGNNELNDQTISSVGLEDGFLARFEANDGQFSWVRLVSGDASIGNSFNIVNEVEVLEDGNVLIGGDYTYRAFFGENTNTLEFVSSNPFRDLFIAQYSSAGVFNWAHKMGANFGDDMTGLVVSEDHRIFVLGDYAPDFEYGFDQQGLQKSSINNQSNGTFLAQFGPIPLQGGNPTKLAFIQQPQDTLLGKQISPDIQVEVQDFRGSRVGLSSTQVTLSLKTNPGSASFTPQTVQAVNGVATFSNLQLDQVGEGYVFEANANSLSSVDSEAFSVRHLPVLSTLHQTMTQSGGNVAVKGMDSLPDGTTAITGFFGGNETIFGNGASTTPTNNVVFFVALYDSNQQLEWVRISDQGGNNNLGLDVALHTDKTVYVTGHFNSPMRLGQDVSVNNTVSLSVPGTASTIHGFLAKYLPNGDLDWAMPINSSPGGIGIDVEALSDGSVLLYGADGDYFLQRFAANSSTLWKIPLSGSIITGNDYDAISSFSNDDFVFSTSFLQLSFVDTTSQSITFPSQTNHNAALVRFTKDGEVIWQTDDGDGGAVFAKDIDVVSSDMILTTGTSSGSSLFDGSSFFATGAYFARYDGSGSLVSVNNISQSGSFFDLHITSLYGDDALVVGSYNTPSASFGSILVPNTELTILGQPREIFMAHFRMDNTLDWVKHITSPGDTLIHGVRKINNGFVIAGDVGGNSLFDENEATEQALSTSASGEGFIARYSLNGVPTASATQLQVTQNPLVVLAEKIIDPPISVEIRDAQNQLVSTANNDVTLSFRLNPHGATTGPFTTTAVNGIATFSNVMVDVVGDGYQFEVSSPGLNTTNTNAFNVYVTNAQTVNVSDSSNTNGANLIPSQVLTRSDGSYFVSGRFTGITDIPHLPSPLRLSSSGVNTNFIVGYGADDDSLFSLPFQSSNSFPRMALMSNGQLLTTGGYILGSGKSAFQLFTVDPATSQFNQVAQLIPSIGIDVGDMNVFSDNAIIITGRLEGNTGNGTFGGLTSIGSANTTLPGGNAYIIRYASDFSPLNGFNVGGANAVSDGVRLIVLSDGGYSLLGKFAGTISLGSDSYTSPDLNTYHGFLARFNAQDQIVWSQDFPVFNSQVDMTLLSDDSIVVFNREDTSLARLTRYEKTNGQILWSQQIGDFDGQNAVFVHALSSLSDDSILGLARSNSKISFTDPLIKTENGLGPVLFRYDKNGVFAWSKMEVGFEATDIDAFANDDFAYAGRMSHDTQTIFNFDQTGQIVRSADSSQEVEYFVAKYQLSLKNRDPIPLRLSFNGVPSGSRNTPLTNISVSVLDEINALVQNQDFPLAIGFEGNPSGVSLSGTTLLTSSLGTADFDDLQITTSGTYQLKVTSADLVDAISPSFFVRDILPTPTNFVMNGVVNAINADNVLNSSFSIDSAVDGVLLYTFSGPVGQNPLPVMNSNPGVTVGTNTFSNFNFIGFDDGQIQASFELLDGNGSNSQQLVLTVLKDTLIDVPTNIVINGDTAITPTNAGAFDTLFEVSEPGRAVVSFQNIYRGGFESDVTCTLENINAGIHTCSDTDISRFRFETDSVLRTIIQFTDLAGNSIFSQAIEQDLLPDQASSLRFVQHPTNVLVGNVFTSNISVELLDQGANRIDTDADVLIAVVPSAGVIFGGTDTVSAVNGLATFSDLQLSTVGSYSFVVSSPGVADVTSIAFDVLEAPLAPSNLQVNGLLNAINADTASNTSFTVEVNVDGILHYTIGDGTQFMNGTKNVSAGVATVELLNLSTYNDGKITFDLFLQGELGDLSPDSLNEVDKDTEAIAPTNLVFNGGSVYTRASQSQPEISFSFDIQEIGAISYRLLDENSNDVLGNASITQVGPQVISFTNFSRIINNQFESDLNEGNLTLLVNFTDSFGNLAIQVQDAELKDTFVHRASKIFLNDGDDAISNIGFVNNLNKSNSFIRFEGVQEIATVDYLVKDQSGGEVTGQKNIDTVQMITEIGPLDLSQLADEKLLIQFSHRDAYGNTDFDSTGFVYDKDAQVSEIDGLLLNGGNPIIGTQKSSVEMNIDTVFEPGSLNILIEDEAEPPHQITRTLSVSQAGSVLDTFDLSEFDDGNVFLRVTFTDAFGNTALEQSTSVEMDTIAQPLSDFLVNGNAPINASRLTDFSITYTAAELGNTVITISELNNSQNKVLINDPITSIAPQIISGDVSILNDDLLNISFDFTDSLGNVAVTQRTIGRRDATNLGLTNIVINGGNVVNGSLKTMVPIVFDAPEAGVASVFFSDGTTEIRYNIQAGPLSPNTALDPILNNTFQSVFLTLDDGQITSRFAFEDHAGNISQGVGPSIQMDTQVDPATNIVVNGGNTINNSQQTTVAVDYNVLESGSSQVIISDGTDQVMSVLVSGSDLNRSQVLDVSTLRDGVLSVSVNFTDEVGNLAITAASTAQKDAQARAITGVVLNNGVVINKASEKLVTLDFNSSEEGIANYTVRNGSDEIEGDFIVRFGISVNQIGSIPVVINDETLIRNIDVSSLPDGELEAEVLFTDDVGNVVNLGLDRVKKDTRVNAPSLVQINNNQRLLHSARSAVELAFDIDEPGNISYRLIQGVNRIESGASYVSLGSYSFQGVNLSGFNASTFQLEMEFTDEAGNSVSIPQQSYSFALSGGLDPRRRNENEIVSSQPVFVPRSGGGGGGSSVAPVFIDETTNDNEKQSELENIDDEPEGFFDFLFGNDNEESQDDLEFKNTELFEDVQEGDEGFREIQRLKDLGVVEGVNNSNVFAPSRFIDRAQILKILMKLMSYEEPEKVVQRPFLDIPTTEWYSPFVWIAKQLGFIDGYPDGSYKPAQLVNKAEAMKMMYRVIGIEPLDIQESIFADIPDEEWHLPYFVDAYHKGILEVDDLGDARYVDPAEIVDRRWFAQMVIRLWESNDELTSKDLDLDQIVTGSAAI
ncbi:MAG: S-layer homology domain-containing protein [Candidatus Gracilibacteria bacterium]|nr:S-layer homology domain-containing protein [Candidatus Gracilibacteria bacterium]